MTEVVAESLTARAKTGTVINEVSCMSRVVSAEIRASTALQVQVTVVLVSTISTLGASNMHAVMALCQPGDDTLRVMTMEFHACIAPECTRRL